MSLLKQILEVITDVCRSAWWAMAIVEGGVFYCVWRFTGRSGFIPVVLVTEFLMLGLVLGLLSFLSTAGKRPQDAQQRWNVSAVMPRMSCLLAGMILYHVIVL